jgi:CBS domain-containing protein
MNKIRVDDVMTHLVVTLRPKDTIEDAARKLGQNRISGAPVVQEGQLVGLVSEADLLRAFAPPSRGSTNVGISPLGFLLRGMSPKPVHNTLVRDVMSGGVVSISPEASVWEAASLLDRHGFRRLPVIDGEGCLIGILTRSDLVRAMADTNPDLVGSP